MMFQPSAVATCHPAVGQVQREVAHVGRAVLEPRGDEQADRERGSFRAEVTVPWGCRVQR
jgi:hypothetical protein